AFAWAHGPAPGQLKWVRFDGGAPAEFEGAPSLFGHSGAPAAMSVAAAPAFAPVAAEPYSSLGGSPLRFDYAGHPMTGPGLVAAPDITGPDQIHGAHFLGKPGGLGRQDGGASGEFAAPAPSGLFAGTSAAAAHVAAVAALQVQQHMGLPPLLINQMLEKTA